MTQLTTGTEDRTVHTAAAEFTSADKPRHPGRRLFGKGEPHAPQPYAVVEQSDLIDNREADLWDEGRAAARAGNHERAVTCFVEEAEARSRQGSHGRAAIAFRTAAEEARLQGMASQRDQLLERAAASYTDAAERNGLAQDATHQAWISAAKCFLQLQQLDQAAWCIEQARTVTDPSSSVDESVKTPL
ncbi:hypothetical protein [Arthrobacter sp. ZGTC412]|uniref:hypothetical protein n=1 Tax=Arthrobacter sp. ZGTC412 TaxID=2058900 RepID=UPI0011B00A26|nr:hypothetical protein [Arthrobacter sp. ZGTC412]